MGVFDFLLSDEKKIKKHQRRITNRDAQPDDRELSARWLAENGTPQALLALLSRFDMVLDHQLKDQGEKDLAYGLLAAHGRKVVEPLEAWLRRCKSLGMPLRLHEEVCGRDATVELVYELLEKEKERQDFRADKKKKLLIWLADVRHPGAVAAAEPFLADFDEGVRYAAAEVIIAQEGEGGRPALLAALVNPEEESNRLKVRIAEIFATRRWSVQGEEGVAASLPEGYRVQNDRIVTA